MALCGLPWCKVYCPPDWVLFLRTFARHLMRCQGCDFPNASEVATLSFIFPSGDVFLKCYAGICASLMLPIDTDRGCTSKSQHSAVEIYPLKARVLLQPQGWPPSTG